MFNLFEIFVADDNIKFVTVNFILFRKYSILTNINFNAIIMLAFYANKANHFLGIMCHYFRYYVIFLGIMCHTF